MSEVSKDHRMSMEDFVMARERMEKIPEEAIDEKIRPLVNAINKSPRLVTLWSCEGHENNPKWDVPYVMVGVRNIHHVQELSHLFRLHLGEKQHMYGVAQTTRINFLADTQPEPGKDVWWPVWVLNLKVVKEFTREEGWEVIAKVARDFERYLSDGSL